MSKQSNTPREFLQSTLAGAAAVGLSATASGAEATSGKGLPTRPLGKTGQKVSILCLGGWHVIFVVADAELLSALRSGQ
jgi:uncharacterized protein